MGRWAPGAQGRLQEAAMALFVENGYEQTTVAGIAARAGLTERTFFRHFSDKREVFFAGQEVLADLVVGELAAVPADLGPLDTVVAALASADEFFDDGRRAGARARQDVIDAHSDLQERELIKLSRLAAAIAVGLRGRGVAAAAADLAAEAGMAVFRLAFERWVHDERGRGFDEHVRDALAEFKAVAAG